MSVKIHANYCFKKNYKTRRLNCSSHKESVLCSLYSILTSDRLNCKVVKANFNLMQNVQ